MVGCVCVGGGGGACVRFNANKLSMCSNGNSWVRDFNQQIIVRHKLLISSSGSQSPLIHFTDCVFLFRKCIIIYM